MTWRPPKNKKITKQEICFSNMQFLSRKFKSSWKWPIVNALETWLFSSHALKILVPLWNPACTKVTWNDSPRHSFVLECHYPNITHFTVLDTVSNISACWLLNNPQEVNTYHPLSVVRLLSGKKCTKRLKCSLQLKPHTLQEWMNGLRWSQASTMWFLVPLLSTRVKM